MSRIEAFIFPALARRLRVYAVALWLAGGLCLEAAPAAPDGGTLLGLINEYRSSPQRCAGRQLPMAGPLTADATLADALPITGGRLDEALRAAGYAAARSLVITLSGPADAGAAMRLLRSNYCTELSSARYSEIGIARDGTRWHIVLAQPLLSPDLGPSRAAGMRVLELVNAARAAPRRCGARDFVAVAAVTWNHQLEAAALTHSSDMARRDYFAHAGPNGERVDARASRQGYDWRAIGENIAAGQGSAGAVVAAWLASPGHCANIMSGDFTEMAAAYAVDAGSTSTIYWTQVFGSRQARARR